ncbi:MAG: hypothetical protein ABI119_05995 [Gemmatimonadaceae bacterium]
MTNKKVSVGGGTRGSAPPPTGNSKAGSSVSHLRPLSEGVLRASGMHGGVDASGNIIDARSKFDGAVDVDADDLPSDEPHVKFLRLQQETGGIISRDTNADGSVTLRLTHGEGDVAAARASDTYTALDALISKVGGHK